MSIDKKKSCIPDSELFLDYNVQYWEEIKKKTWRNNHAPSGNSLGTDRIFKNRFDEGTFSLVMV